MIRIGYVSLNTSLPSSSRTFRLSSYSEKRMLEVAKSNILALKNILEWNKKHHIFIFRISSDLIPFGSSRINSGLWKTYFKDDLETIGKYILENKMRVSMHPGQYTVINSPISNVFNNALLDLEYHESVLSLMKLDLNHKIVIHSGGGYEDKGKSKEVLIERIQNLPTKIRNRLVLENDDRIFTAEEVLNICLKTNLPAVFDTFHHSVNKSFGSLNDRDIIVMFKETWQNQRQKIHYSNQDPYKRQGAHSKTVDIEKFLTFFHTIQDLELDIMLETKDKEQSALKVLKIIKQ